MINQGIVSKSEDDNRKKRKETATMYLCDCYAIVRAPIYVIAYKRIHNGAYLWAHLDLYSLYSPSISHNPSTHLSTHVFVSRHLS